MLTRLTFRKPFQVARAAICSVSVSVGRRQPSVVSRSQQTSVFSRSLQSSVVSRSQQTSVFSRQSQTADLSLQSQSSVAVFSPVVNRSRRVAVVVSLHVSAACRHL